MNEKILDALMRLFALISDPDDFGNMQKSRSVVEAFLKGIISSNMVGKYLTHYDQYLLKYRGRSIGNETRKQLSVSSVKVLKICDQLNLELHYREKVFVTIQLIAYVYIDGVLSERERDFLETVSQAFNIDPNEFMNILSFMENDISLAADSSKFMYVDSRPDSPAGTHHSISPEMDGFIRILHVASVSTYFFIYTGLTQKLKINGRPIQNGKVYIFENGGIIRGDKIGSIYQSDVANVFTKNPEAQAVTFCGEDVEFTYKNYDYGLKPFSFSVESGTMVGIMGGSGTGKSTLLNVLTGKYKLDRGAIYINGHNVTDAEVMPEGVIGIVPQDDLLIAELTVWQNLYYNSKLCLGNLPDSELVAHVEKVLMDLDLFGIKDLKVGDALNNVISGGQRKRLNIALELVREPSILFVDEPTSGLSSTDSETVMQLLKQQANSGKIVIVNIHQPSSSIFKLFDKLWVMDRGGYIVYNGNPMEAVTYFKLLSDYVDAGESECPTCGNVNSEEILQIIESRVVNQYGVYTQERKVSPQEWYSRYKESREFEFADDISKAKNIMSLPKTKFTVPNRLSQFWVFLKRNIMSKLSNRQYLAITFLESPLLAFILGFFTKYINDEGEYIFADNRNLPVFLFMIVVVALFTGLTCSAEEIIRDRKILEREKFLNLSRFSYITNKVLLVFLISAIQTISFILIANEILEIKGMTVAYWFVMFSTSCTANMMGLLISSALDSVIAIYVLIPFVLVPQMLLGGAMIDFDDLHESVSDKINVPLIGDFMASRWAYEALAVEQFQNNEYERQLYDYDSEKSHCIYLSTYLMSELDNIASRSLNLVKVKDTDPDAMEEFLNNLEILRNEIEYLNYRNPSIHFDEMADLTPEKYENVGNLLLLFLRAQKEYYNEMAELINNERQLKLSRMENELGKDGLYQLQKDYYNEKLSELVLNKLAVKKFYNAPNHRLIQKKDPIFMEPVSDWGRAHFYAPCKIIRNNRIPTYRFNMSVLWIWSLLMFLLLIFDVPRKGVNFLQKFLPDQRSR